MSEIGLDDFPACSQTWEFSKGQAKTSAHRYLGQEVCDLSSCGLASVGLGIFLSHR